MGLSKCEQPLEIVSHSHLHSALKYMYAYRHIQHCSLVKQVTNWSIARTTGDDSILKEEMHECSSS